MLSYHVLVKRHDEVGRGTQRDSTSEILGRKPQGLALSQEDGGIKCPEHGSQPCIVCEGRRWHFVDVG